MTRSNTPVALVTGASEGIDFEVARSIAKSDYVVPLGLVEQRGEIFALNEFELCRFAQPLKDFFDEQRLLDAIRPGNVDVCVGSGEVAPELGELSHRQCRSMKV
jgi:NAD(P)-dependent dehydrogenase (short-subunit alcohol dehydrogenase family)